jgi:hypothetical protein
MDDKLNIESLPEYVYEALSAERYFRLMILLPGSKDDPLRCALGVLPLGSVNDYAALSYVWGDSTVKVPMWCNGRRLYITENLHAALIHLRHPERWFRFWVDAICIDQSSIQDRNNQVSLMKNIYEGADQVFIWLGPADDLTDRAWYVISTLSDLYKQYVEAPKEKPLLTDPNTWQRPDQLSDTLRLQLSDGHPTTSASNMFTMHRLLLRPWFSRSWVVQEVVVCKSALVVCGQRAMHWDTLQNACKCVMRSGRSHTLMGVQHNAHMMDLLRSTLLQNVDHHQRRLTNLLIELRNFRASDPRDKIFSVLGIAIDGTHPALVPDYGSDFQKVFADTTRHLIQTDEHLQVLSQAGSSSSPEDLPSWVPDWRNWSKTSPNIYLLHPRWKKCFSAAGPSKPIITPTPDPIHLSLRGFSLDTIRFSTPDFWFQGPSHPDLSKATNPLALVDDPISLHNNAMGSAESFLLASNAIKDPEESYRLAYHRTLSFDYFVLAENCFPGRSESAFWYTTMPVTFRCLTSSAPNADLFSSEVCREWIKNVKIGLRGRKLFLTKAGYFGLGPAGMEKGDVVCILLGGHVPFVLRRDGDEYRLIGECYLHTMMDGEAIKRTEVEGFEYTDFTIK